MSLFDRDGEAKAFSDLFSDRLGIDADYSTVWKDERPSAVAGVYCGVHLDDPQAIHLPKGAHYSLRDGPVESKRIADDIDLLSQVNLQGRGHFQPWRG